MKDAIAVTSVPDFRALTLTRSATGHVHSPWFTFPVDFKTCYDIGSKYHDIIARAKDAFATAVGTEPNRVLVTSRQSDVNEFETWWRLGTVDPMPVPEKKVNRLAAGAIEI